MTRFGKIYDLCNINISGNMNSETENTFNKYIIVEDLSVGHNNFVGDILFSNIFIQKIFLYS